MSEPTFSDIVKRLTDEAFALQDELDKAQALIKEAGQLLVYLLTVEALSTAARGRVIRMVEQLRPGYFATIGMAKPPEP